MRRMVDDKEMISIDNRITALEEGGANLRLIAGNGINIETGEVLEDKIISVNSTKVAFKSELPTNYITTDSNQTGISGYKKFESGQTSVTIYPSGSVYTSNAYSRGTSYRTDTIECSGGVGATPANFVIMNYYDGGYGRHEFDRTEKGTVATREYVQHNSKHFEDETNPEEYYTYYPTNYNDFYRLGATQDDNSHPCDTEIKLNPIRIILEANNYNHGADDDTYTGSIEVMDNGVTIEATDGTNTNTLVVSPTQVTINGSIISGVTPTIEYLHQLSMKWVSSTGSFYINVTVRTNSATVWTTSNAIANYVDASVAAAGNNYSVNGYGYNSTTNSMAPLLGFYAASNSRVVAVFMNTDGTESQQQLMNPSIFTCGWIEDNVTPIVTNIQ